MLAPNTVTAERLEKLETLARRPGTPGEGAAARAAIARIRARVHGPPTIVGLVLRLDRSCDRGPTGCCDRRGVVCESVGPHRNAVRCHSCRRHRGWLRREAADLLAAMQADGRLSAEPTLRDRGIVP